MLDARQGKALSDSVAALNNKIIYKLVTLTPYATKTADAWENTGNTVTIPSGHVYLCSGATGWSFGKPIGLGFNQGTSLTGDAPQYATESASSAVHRSAVFILESGTWYLFVKRASAGSTTNTYYVRYIDIVL